jgi:hypothetical protein
MAQEDISFRIALDEIEKAAGEKLLPAKGNED